MRVDTSQVDLSRIQAICFDAGNVLIGVNFDRVQPILRSFGYEVTREAFAEAELLGRDSVNIAVRDGEGKSNKQHGSFYYRRIVRELGVDEQHVDEIWKAIQAESNRANIWNWSPPETRSVIERIKAKGYRVGVVSNADGTCETMLHSLNLDGIFEFIIDSHVIGIEKPDPRIFQMAVEKFGLQAAQVLYVGDLYHIDVVGSCNAGLQSALVHPKLACSFGNCFIVRNLQHLLDELPSRTTKS